MVRFKNRWLLVEFLQPSQLAPSGVLSSPLDGLPTLPVLEEDEQQSEDEEDESYPHASSSKLPFMLPVAGPPRPLLSGDAKTRQKTLSTYIRQSVLETFGDDGHSKCSSLAVSYFSPATSLAILRISRDHYRLASAAVNFITQIEGTRVVPRTVYVSGTLKKLSSQAQAYHRLVTGRMLASHLDSQTTSDEAEALWAAERAELAGLIEG